MRYIKTFENQKKSTSFISYYWVLPVDERFIPSLMQIECPSYAQKEFQQDMKYIEIEKENFVIVYYSAIENFNPWRLASYSLIGLFEENYTFGGFINIEDYELDADKYNL